MSPYGLLADGDISSYPRHITTTLVWHITTTFRRKIWHITTTLNPYILHLSKIR